MFLIASFLFWLNHTIFALSCIISVLNTKRILWKPLCFCFSTNQLLDLWNIGADWILQFHSGCNEVVIKLFVVQFWSEIIFVISNRTCTARLFDFKNYAYDFRPNCSRLISITIINQLSAHHHNVCNVVLVCCRLYRLFTMWAIIFILSVTSLTTLTNGNYASHDFFVSW